MHALEFLADDLTFDGEIRRRHPVTTLSEDKPSTHFAFDSFSRLDEYYGSSPRAISASKARTSNAASDVFERIARKVERR
jgi:hypothetical protein